MDCLLAKHEKYGMGERKALSPILRNWDIFKGLEKWEQ
jgi:hypothetical protein